MGSFGLLLIAVDDYPNPPGRLPSSENAARLAELLVGERGGILLQQLVAKSREEIIEALETWAGGNRDQPLSTIVYLVGHGTDDGLDHSFIAPSKQGTVRIPIASLRPQFEEDWIRRQGDRASWTLFVLDCCGANIGLINLQTALGQHAIKYPRRLGMWPTTPQGGITSGKFIDALDRALARFNENDATISLNELFRRMQPELGEVDSLGNLPQDAALRNPLHAPTPTVMNLDAHQELRRVVSKLPAEMRSHFLSKAQGAETGDLAWHFKGREKEVRTLCAWLADASLGMRVVTGAAGSGKSALLGYLSVLANDELVNAYAAAELAPGLSIGPRPPPSVFDATIHLTGKTLADVLDGIYSQVNAAREALPAEHEMPPEPMRFWAGTSSELIRRLRERAAPAVVLVDALDEAQEPKPIANMLRMLVRGGVAKVLVGTRPSVNDSVDLLLDPEHKDLLEALEAAGEDIIVVEKDREAIHSYIVERLSDPQSPYADDLGAIRSLADRIAGLNQPFLFAKLATTELLARPALAPGAPELAMLNEGHRGIFRAAVARIGAQAPAAAVMLRALAFARGRGLPESGGIWVAVARAIAGDITIPDTAVELTIELAAPYILLDAEGGQSTYRLAHYTFVGDYTQIYVEEIDVDAKIAAALLDLTDRSGGWPAANYYAVRYLPYHIEAGFFMDVADLTTNPAWLRRAVGLLGVDRTVQSIANGGLSLSPSANVIQKALRRCRIPLSRDPLELAGQMQARLRNLDDPRLARLGEALAAKSPETTLRMRHGNLDWMADVETTYGLGGKLRALAFGRIDDEVMLAIGVDDRIHLWNPLRGSSDTRVFENEGRRVNALAFSDLDDRPVLVVASWYDGQVGVIRSASTGEQVGDAFPLDMYIDSLAMGLVGRRTAIVGCGNGQISAWDWHARTSIAMPESLRNEQVRAVAELDGQVVACVVRRADQQHGASIVDVATGADVWPNPTWLDGELGATAAGHSDRDGFIVTGYVDRRSIVTWSPKERVILHRLDPSAEFDVPVRVLATAEVDAVSGQKVVALGPDHEGTTLVKLCEIQSAFKIEQKPVGDRRWQGPQIESVFSPKAGPKAGRLLALTNSPVSLYELTANGRGPPLDAAPDQATVAFALTGRDSAPAFACGDRRELVRPPTEPQLDRDLRARTPLRPDRPDGWPRTAWAWGELGGRAVVAAGSVGGAVWIWDELGQPIAGPLTTVSPRMLELGRIARIIKGGPPSVESLALGRHPDHGDIIAIAMDGRVRLVSLVDGEAVPTPTTRARVITSVALGRIGGQDVLVTGSKGGVLIVWGLVSGERIASLTLDRGIDRVWVVHGTDAVAAQARKEVFVLDVTAGADDWR